MSIQLIVMEQPKIGGGTGVTAICDAVDQAIYWELVSYDPVTETEGVAMGSLLYEKTITDGSMRTKNYYFSPSNVNLTGKVDRIKARIAHA